MLQVKLQVFVRDWSKVWPAHTWLWCRTLKSPSIHASVHPVNSSIFPVRVIGVLESRNASSPPQYTHIINVTGGTARGTRSTQEGLLLVVCDTYKSVCAMYRFLRSLSTWFPVLFLLNLTIIWKIWEQLSTNHTRSVASKHDSLEEEKFFLLLNWIWN